MRAKGTDREWVVAFRQAFTPFVSDQGVVVPVGNGQAKQRLEQPVDMACIEEVAAPGHQGHTLQGIVPRNRKMVATGNILAPENDVTEAGRVGPLRSGAPLAISHASE